jgi:hypothetical protein
MFVVPSQPPKTTLVSPAAAGLKPLALLREELRFGIRRYIRSQTPAVARQVVCTLEGLICHPDFHADLAERCICKRMLTSWRLLSE